jgi:hypothetical protein
MPTEPISSSGRRPKRSIVAMATSGDGDQRGQDVHHDADHRDEQRVALVEPDRLPQHAGVVEDHVDADELLKHRQQDADPHDRQQSQRRAAQVPHARSGLVHKRVPDLDDLGVQVDVPKHPAQHLACLVQVTLGHQMPWRLGDGQRQHAVEHRGHRHGEEHPPPGLQAQQPLPLRPTRGGGDRPVGQQRQEDAKHDRQLLQRPQSAADPGRRDLRDVGRRDHRGGAHRDAADEPEHGQAEQPERHPGAQTAGGR